MVVVAVVAALGAAASNSLAAYLQQSANKQLSSDESLHASDLPALLRQPRWLGGQVFDVSAFLLQAVALAFGSLIFVEPLLVMSLPISVGLGAWSARRWPGAVGIGGAAICVGAISAFTLAARPKAGSSVLTTGEAVEMMVAVVVLLAICLAAARFVRGNARAVAFAAGASVVYGVTAGLTKVVTTQLQHHGILEPLVNWELYVAIATGITGVLLTQNALKPGALAAPVAVITMGDPLVAIAIGLLWLGETVNAATWAVAVEVAAIFAMAVGVALLAHQSKAASAPAAEEHPQRGGSPVR